MPRFYTPTPDERRVLDRPVAQVHDVQRTLVANHSALRQPDRAAHQQQLAGGRVALRVADPLPGERDGSGFFGAARRGIENRDRPDLQVGPEPASANSVASGFSRARGAGLSEFRSVRLQPDSWRRPQRTP